VRAAGEAARARYTPSLGPSMRGKTTSPITGAPVYTPATAAAGAVATAEARRLPQGAASGGGPEAIGGVPVLTAAPSSSPFVTAGDLICGGIISVYGRPLLLKTCDPYTVAFGLLRFGFDQRALFIADQVRARAGGRGGGGWLFHCVPPLLDPPLSSSLRVASPRF
jgi:hypothetical protein